MRFVAHGDALAPFDWLRGEMDRLFERVTPGADGAWTPPLTLHETESAFEARLPVVGADPEKLEISVEGSLLRVAGKREGTPADAVRRYTTERLSGEFRREFQLPAAVDAERVEAHYGDGILTVTLPKAPEALPRRIPVEV